MKHILLGTTALVAAVALSAPALSAERIQLELRGYHVGGISYMDGDLCGGDRDLEYGGTWSDCYGGDYNNITFGSDSEIHFRGSTTLDNGMEIAFVAELELEDDPAARDSCYNNEDRPYYSQCGPADVIDEVYITFSGGFGLVKFGQDDGAMFAQHIAAPNVFVGHGVNQPNIRMDPFVNHWANPIDTYAHFTKDVIKLTYFTPQMNGFQLGFSYTPNPCQNGPGYTSGCVWTEFGRNFIEASFAWEIALSNMMIGLSGGYGGGQSGSTGNEPKEWSVGADVEFGGFTIGGSYADKDIWTGGRSQTHWDIGVTYETGPWGFGLQYATADGDMYGWENSNPSYYRDAGDDADTWLAGVTFDYGPGMQMGFGIQTLDVQDNWIGDWGDTLAWEGFDGTAVFIENSMTF